MKMTDGITALANKLANRRNSHNTNRISTGYVTADELRAIYRAGIGSKIVRLKTGIALDDSLQFESEADSEFYHNRLAQKVKDVAKYQLAFGRGLFVIHEPGADLGQPMPRDISDWSSVRYHVFSGDMVYVQSVNLDLSSPNYFRPDIYNVRGHSIHPSRVVDFRYVEPVEHDAPHYHYGGISEFELIRNELVADQILQRAVPSILEKSSTLFYKINGFKTALQAQQEDQILNFIGATENARSIYGAGIIDSEDSVETHEQALTNLAESDMITLRRLSMVTGLPLSWLVGEAAKGLNTTGEGERQVMKQTIRAYQSDYLLDNINRLMWLHGRGPVSFKDGVLETQEDQMKSEALAIDNALKLWQMGKDFGEYLERHDVTTPDPWRQFFGAEEDEDAPEPPPVNPLAGQSGTRGF